MKIKNGFILRENMVGNDNTVGIVISVDEKVKLNGYLQLDELGIFIWKLLEKGVTKEEIISAILSEYEGASKDVVEKDVESFINKLIKIGVIDE